MITLKSQTLQIAMAAAITIAEAVTATAAAVVAPIALRLRRPSQTATMLGSAVNQLNATSLPPSRTTGRNTISINQAA